MLNKITVWSIERDAFQFTWREFSDFDVCNYDIFYKMSVNLFWKTNSSLRKLL